MNSEVLIDTGFLIRLLNPEDALHECAAEYYKYFLDNGYIIRASTLAIAEYCVRGNVELIPFRNILPLPFTNLHAVRAGELARIVFCERKNGTDVITERKVIPNDTNQFAQADVEKGIKMFLSADSEACKVYNRLKDNINLDFTFTDIRNETCKETFNLLF